MALVCCLCKKEYPIYPEQEGNNDLCFCDFNTLEFLGFPQVLDY